jgi:outer membrane protein OmpA-like peptidoglycan-associated protein
MYQSNPIIKGEPMQRRKLIAILLLLLLLLLIICVWCHSADIVEKRILAQKQIAISTAHPINFKLDKVKNNFKLAGNFSKQENVTLITKTLDINRLENVSHIDKNLKTDNPIIQLSQKLIPLFSEKYNEGSISYDGHTLIVSGTVNKQMDQEEIHALLQSSQIKSVNKTHVLIKKPISLTINKAKEQITLQGALDTEHNADTISNSIQSPNLQNNIKIDTNYQSNAQLIDVLKELIPIFEMNYVEGQIQYQNEQLTINGRTENQEAQQKIEMLLQNTYLNYFDNTEIMEVSPSEEELATLKAIEDAKTKEARKKAEAKAQEVQKEEKAEEKAKKVEKEILNTIALENINFKLNRAELAESSIETVQNIANILHKYPKVNIEIGGHTDDSGDDTYNLDLSQKRVNNVKKQLATMGIAAERLKAIGYGESKPLVSNDTEENRRKNRRVEFKVIGE